jgi:hypothetical protein
MNQRIACKRCGQIFRMRKAGGVRAHQCPHGLQCLPPARTRKKPEHCAICFEARQGVLFERDGTQRKFFE